ncbi:MAG TPA: hypothetical protein VG944_08760 [Fimbriimonas sp.]|nr:hypothetical protein [Fimbriimonas sp.]
MNKELKTPMLVGVVAVVVVVLGFWMFKSISSVGNLDQGQVKYTPGVPPWKEADPSKRGPGTTVGGPAAGGPGGPPGVSAPQVGGKS